MLCKGLGMAIPTADEAIKTVRAAIEDTITVEVSAESDPVVAARVEADHRERLVWLIAAAQVLLPAGDLSRRSISDIARALNVSHTTIGRKLTVARPTLAEILDIDLPEAS